MNESELNNTPNTLYKSKIWLSIMVPVHDVYPYLEECLNSILEQIIGRRDVELIVIDDCSQDGSVDIFQRMLAGRTGNVQMLHHAQNRGVSAARNSMLEAANGEYVWFVDSDDAILPGAIARAHAITAAYHPDVIMADYIRENQKTLRTFKGETNVLLYCREALIQGIFVNRRLHVWSKIWKRDLFGEKIRFPEGVRFEDVATVPWLLLNAKSFYYAAEAWIYYRSRPNSIMAQINKRSTFDTRGNDDMAHALDGFTQALATALPNVTEKTNLLISQYTAREFVKICKRLLLSFGFKTSLANFRQEAARYRTTMELNCPLGFAAVAQNYLFKGKIVRAVALYLALAVSRRGSASPCSIFPS